MPSAHDIAAYILARTGEETTLRLQKLLYYSQAWSLAWDGAPLFSESLRAWENGPVVGEVFYQYRGRRVLREVTRGDPGALTQAQRDTVDAVLAFYRDKSPEWLSELSHREPPWRDARAAAAPGATPSPKIPHEAMRAYYGAIPTGPGKHLPPALMRGLELLVDLRPEEVAALAEPCPDEDAQLAAWLRGDDVPAPSAG